MPPDVSSRRVDPSLPDWFAFPGWLDDPPRDDPAWPLPCPLWLCWPPPPCPPWFWPLRLPPPLWFGFEFCWPCWRPDWFCWFCWLPWLPWLPSLPWLPWLLWLPCGFCWLAIVCSMGSVRIGCRKAANA